MRLIHVEGDLDFEDQVQYCSSRRWGLVCYDEWDNRDAEVVCRQLGYSMEGKFTLFYLCPLQYYHHHGMLICPTDQYALATESRFTLDSRPAVLNRVSCDGTESDISLCAHDNRAVCLKPGAGVICPKHTNCELVSGQFYYVT